MTLRVDDAAEVAFKQIIDRLRSVRIDTGLSRSSLSSRLPVNAKAVFEWEARNIQPTMEHLMLWGRVFDLGLEIAGPDGVARSASPRQLAGEVWVTRELRRLAVPLRNSRRARGMTLHDIGELTGVTKGSVQRWESARAAPRPLALIVWARTLDLSVVLHPVEEHRSTRRSSAP